MGALSLEPKKTLPAAASNAAHPGIEGPREEKSVSPPAAAQIAKDCW